MQAYIHCKYLHEASDIQTKRLIITRAVQVVKILFKGTGFDRRRKRKKHLRPTGLIFSFK